jgi:hypothetical protein
MYPMYALNARTLDMSHLHTERLAALADESPTPAEQAHLAACGDCARERAAHEAVLAKAKLAPHISAPLTTWETLAPALRADGIIGTAPAPRRAGEVPDIVPRRSTIWRLSQVAAAVLLVAGGMTVGRMTAPNNGGEGLRAIATTEGEVIPHFVNADEAQRELSRAEVRYQAAVAYLARHDTITSVPESIKALEARVQALGSVITPVREALRDAPYDPVLSNLYLAATGSRDATVRQLNSGLPSSVRTTVY